MKFSTNTLLGHLKSLLKRVQVITRFEIFEKWFSLGVKLLWIALFVTFGIYLRKEYKKDIYYMKDFKVPASWVEQGYTGDVVKEAIIDEIEAIRQEAFGKDSDKSLKSSRSKDDDNTEFLTDISVEGFNLKAVVKSALALLGKKNKTIGGYITMSDSVQTLSVQITDQVTAKVNIQKNEPIQNLLHKASLQIMNIKKPYALIYYYFQKKDTLAVYKTEKYIRQNRDAIRDVDYFYAQTVIALFKKNYEKAEYWADSILIKFPDDMSSYTTKAYVYDYRAFYNKTDSVNRVKYENLFLKNLKQALIHNKEDGVEVPVNEVYLQYAAYYMRKGNVKLGKEYLDQADKIEPFTAAYNNRIAYYYMSKKDYSAAEKALKKATETDDNGDYWDSLGELYAKQGKDSLTVVYLQKALKSPLKSIAVSKKAYQKDPRWERLMKRSDFKKILQ